MNKHLPTALVVENDPLIRKLIKKYLEEFGYNLLASLESIDETTIYNSVDELDVLILDINLPGDISGVEFGQRFSKEYDTPIIFVTGSHDYSLFEEACKSNMYGYLKKPLAKIDLIQALKIVDVRKQFENRIKDVEIKLKRKEKAAEIGEFAGALVHDLNNFTMVISSSFDRITKLVSVTDKPIDVNKVKNVVSVGKKSTGRLIDLSDKYRRFFFNDTNETPKEVKFIHFLEELQSFFKDRIVECKASVIIEVQRNAIAKTKELVLMQVLSNLLSNSLYELKNNSNIEDKWIKISVKYEENNSLIVVTDSGMGIDSTIANKIFDDGFSTKKFTSTSGAGVGMSFVKKSVEEELNGKIWLDRNSKNTCFKVLIPNLQ